MKITVKEIIKEEIEKSMSSKRNSKKLSSIVNEEIETFKQLVTESNDFDGVSKKAEILKAIADFAKSIEKFETTLTSEMMNIFSQPLEMLKEKLVDVGKNPDSYLDRQKAVRRVVLRKSDDEKTLHEEIETFESLKDAVNSKTQNK